MRLMFANRAWVFVAALTAALIGLVVWRSASQPAEETSTLSDPARAAMPLLSDSLFTLADSESAERSEPTSAVLVGFDPLLEGETVHADAEDVPVPLPQGVSVDQPTPGQLRAPAAALPIDLKTADAERQLDELVARELAALPEHQRAVWKEVLQGLPPKEAEEILQIWKLTGRFDSSAAQLGWPKANVDPPAAAHPEHELPVSLAATVRENLRHLDTPGYRRHTPGLTPEAPPQLDLQPGELRSTGNPMHVAIVGHGFFRLTREKQAAYTRNGAFDLSAEGELVQRRRDGDWGFEPAIQIPSDAVQLAIAETGEVRARRRASQDRWETCGRINLALFLNPQHLDAATGDFLRPTAATGEAFLTDPAQHGVGRLLQGSLEMSNATLAGETELLNRWEQREALWRRIPTAAADSQTRN
jgi:flagellar basal body rod protein FlgF